MYNRLRDIDADTGINTA